MLRALNERARIGDHGERAAAEHHRRRDPFVELGDQLAGPVPIAADLPAIHRRPRLGSERGLELVDGARRAQLVIAPEIGEWGRGHARPARGAIAGGAARALLQRGAGPGEAPDLRRGDPRRAADVGLEAFGPGVNGAPRGVIPGGLGPIRRALTVASLPRGEPRVHRLQALARPLVGVGHDPLLARRERRPAPVALAIEQPGDRMAGHRAGQLGVSDARQPRRRALTVGEGARRIVGRQQLVGIVEQCRGLDEAPVDGHAPGIDPRRQPAGDLGHGARVTDEPGGRIQGEQEGGGLHPPRHRHRLDGTRRWQGAPGVPGVPGVAGRARRVDGRRPPALARGSGR